MNPLHPKYRFYWLLLFFTLAGLGVSYLLRPELPAPGKADASKYKPVVLPVYPDLQAINQQFEYLKQKGIYHPLRNKTKTKPKPPPPPKPKKTDDKKKQEQKKKEKPRVAWVLRGVVEIAETPHAIVEVQNRTKWYSEGDSLPNGEELLHILSDRITIEEKKKQKTVQLYE